MTMYKTKCECGGQLYVTGYRVSTRLLLCADGFSTAEAEYYDTEDEVVECFKCGLTGNLQEIREDGS